MAPEDQVETCEDAVATVADSQFDPGTVVGGPDRVTVYDEGYAEFDCRDNGAVVLVRTGDGWRVQVPYCTD